MWETGSGVLRPLTRLGPWGFLTLGHLGNPGSHRRAEKTVRENREFLLVSASIVLSLASVVAGHRLLQEAEAAAR